MKTMLLHATRRTGGSDRWIALYALPLAVWAIVPAIPAHASTSLFTNTGTVCTVAASCWDAGDFGVLVGVRNTSTWVTATVNYAEVGANGADINGEIGVGSGSKLVFNAGSQSRTWDGPVDFADALNGTSGFCGASGTTGCAVPSGNTLTKGADNIRV